MKRMIVAMWLVALAVSLGGCARDTERMETHVDETTVTTETHIVVE